MIKYPRTRHILGSRLQPGDEDLEAVAHAELRDAYLVVEEKIDGANAAVSFDQGGRLLLQSRGHYLRGGPREKHFALFKTWASRHQDALRERLGARFVMYGEWAYAKHTIFYDRLPHYFLEFDLFDRQEEIFLSTDRRAQMLRGLPVVSVPVLTRGRFADLETLVRWIGPSRFKSDRWRERLREVAERVSHVSVDRVEAETDAADAMEGLYVKHEGEGRVIGRYKYVRAAFLQAVFDSSGHWLDRPIVPNQLDEGVDLFAPSLPEVR